MSLPRTNLDLRAYVPLVAALFAATVTMWAPQAFNDGDTWWHVAAGRWMIEHREVPHVDVFSYTMAGRNWQTHEWLAELLMAGPFLLAGWSGVLVLYGFFTGVAAYLVARHVTRYVGGISVIVVLILAFACMGPSLLLRPHLLMLPLLATWILMLMQARDNDRAPHISWALFIIPWANLHGSFVFAYVTAGTFALEALVDAKTWPDRIRVVRDWGLFGLAAVVAALATPHGVEGMMFPFQVMTMTTLSGINEWQPSNFGRITAFEVGILAVLFIGLSRGVKMPVIRLLLLLLLTHMALAHVRHVIVLAMLAPLLLAQPLGQALSQRPATRPPPRHVLIITLVLGLVGFGVRLAIPKERTDNVSSPITALAAVPEHVRRRPVFNEYAFGGYLIFAGVRPYIDGRADMYGDEFFRNYLRAIRPVPGVFESILTERDIAWTILVPSNPDVHILDNRPGWRRLITTRRAVVHVRNDVLPPEPGPATPSPAPALSQPRGTNAPPATTR